MAATLTYNSPDNPNRGEIDMRGGIYCGKCGKPVPAGVCEKHPRARLRVQAGGVQKRFRDRGRAERFLNFVRFQTDEGKWEPDDYRRDNPLLLKSLVKEFLAVKAATVSPHTAGCYDRWLTGAIRSWGAKTSIKDIGYREIELHVLALKASSKTRANVCNGLHHFFRWVWRAYRDRLRDARMPEFPDIEFTLAYRKTLTKEDQQAVLDELHRQTWDRNPRIWLAVFLLATYPSIRPKELRGVLKEDLELEQGFIRITKGKVKPKQVPILAEDAELIRTVRDMTAGTLRGARFFDFGPALLYRWWKRACQALGIEGVGLYAGTKHTTVMALDAHFGKEEIQDATGVTTNKAFERYYGQKPDRQRQVYRQARPQITGGIKVEKVFPLPQKAQTPNNKGISAS